MKVALIAGHDAQADRKVDFHFWADILAAKGTHVDFINVSYSYISVLKKDPRVPAKPFNQWVRLSDHLKKFAWMPPYHPFLNNKLVNLFTAPFFALLPCLFPKAALDEIKDADVFIVESCAALMLVPRLAKLCPKAKFIYSVSDRLKTLGAHPAVLRYEQNALPHFDLIRVPAAIMQHDFEPTLPVRYIAPALEKTAFNDATKNPYKKPHNVVSIGDMLFDAPTIETMARNFPDWNFHLIGKGAHLSRAYSNVTEYGEKAFADLVPYIKFADIGLAPYGNAPNVDYLSQSSLKMIQYTYCQLPIVAPFFAAAGRKHVCAYTPGDEASILAAFDHAITYDRTTINAATIQTWDQMLETMLG